jgi:hypothetical protein
MKNMNEIKTNWSTERCKLKNIPFAGLINKPDNLTIHEYTSQNFEFCNQNILKEISGYALMPITYSLSSVMEIFTQIVNAIQEVRTMISSIRTNIEIIVKDVMNRIMNVIIPIQKIIISFNDLMLKLKGVLTASIYTVLSVYYSLESALGVVVNSIVVILIVMAVIIVILWILPFTWAAAAVGTVTFVSISVPLALILVFMSNIMHITPSVSIPGVPSMCFDENVLLEMNNGEFKKIKNVNVGEYLKNNVLITSKMKLKNIEQIMCSLDCILVTPEHMVLYNNSWIHTREHPNAEIINNYNKDFLYCINTDKKKIHISGVINKYTEYIFLDWDELICDSSAEPEFVHREIDGGFLASTQICVTGKGNIDIKDVEVDDVLYYGNEKVYGIVEIYGKDIKQHTYHLAENISFSGGPNIIFNINDILDYNLESYSSSLEENDNINKVVIKTNEDKLYHLLTYDKKFLISPSNDENNCIVILDYNNNIEYYL